MRKEEVKTAATLLKPKTTSKFCLIPAHARTSLANILYLDQKAAKYSTFKQLSGNFKLFIARK